VIVKEGVLLPIIEAIKKGDRRIGVRGLTGSSKALLLSHPEINSGPRPMAIITPTEDEAEAIYKDIIFFRRLFPEHYYPSPIFFPSIDHLSYGLLKQDSKVIGTRIKILFDLVEGGKVTLITHSEAIINYLPRMDCIVDKKRVLRPGGFINRDILGEELIEIGYRRVPLVTDTGEFSIRGGIIDIYSPYHPHPIRIELFGDEIESLREFDHGSQRSIRNLDEGIILPVIEDLDNPTDTIFDYLPQDCLIVLDEPYKIYERINHLRDGEARSLTPERIDSIIEGFQLLTIEPLQLSEKGRIFNLDTESIEAQLIKGISSLAERLREWRRGYRVFLTCNTIGQAERLRDLLIEADIDCYIKESGPIAEDSKPIILIGSLSKGFIFHPLGLIFITEGEIFGERIRRRVPSRSRLENLLNSIEEIKTGDYIVHIDYGIGRYLGIKRLRVDGYESDFLLINYAGGDRLYLPLDRIDRVQRYIGPEGFHPELNRLGGTLWQRTKERIKKEIEEMARDLLELYAEREVIEGYRFSSDSYLHHEFDTSFGYEETPDQMKAIWDVKRDMEEGKPMDRLICGDVGYGKTEVAMRASFKAIYDGKQVAILVPTTILAEQHYQTFSERFSAFPVRIEVLSRFKTRKEQLKILNDLEAGTIDIIIGTHRLLQGDVRFKDLGLLIVDEEQRFGVRHKEKLKVLKKSVDVLTLTATPIPRTLHMALSAVRDLSVINTPPEDRLAVKTIVARFDKEVIREAILRELARGGQVFFVHNRVKTMGRMLDYLKRIVPEARIGMAHGQLRERELEGVMIAFLKKEIDLLLTSAIIESGLDIPSANTILINHADKFGLADLYQLRGRVGRSNRRAYAYFLVSGGWSLTDDARKRLRAIQELSELGAGFKIAMRDLEIRGAGNLLGPQQSGHITAIGLDLYTQMLERAVLEIKGGESPPLEDPVIDIKISAFIPEDYIPDIGQRLSIYRKIASIRAEDEIQEISEELRDRFGKIPVEVSRLLDIMTLKILARALRIKRIEKERGRIDMIFCEGLGIPTESLLDLLNKRGSVRFIHEYGIQIEIGDKEWDETFKETKNFLKDIIRYVTKERS